ncbi:MAG: cold shock domain-containing protein [Halobacteria archaeon]|nr:cold shock domain-containing protein [Halobacteria archaeon]
MTDGTVTFFHDKKGYGFIDTEEEDDDVFFHISEVSGTSIEEGTEVSFEITEGDKGPKAVNIERL